MAENDDVGDEIDWNSAFTTGRIKSQVMNDDLGRLTNRAAEYIGACSALFLHSLAAEAKNSSDDSIVTLEHVRQSSTKHGILEGVLDHTTEQSAPKLPRKKKRKLANDLKDTAVQNAVVASDATAVASFQQEITVDEDDYD